MNTVTHSPALLAEHPTLRVVVLDVAGDLTSLGLDRDVEQLLERARHRLSVAPESQWPAVQAWRAAFTTMGLTPTKYRNASEALLRRIRTHDVFPRLHRLIDLCNAASAAHGVPIAVLDVDKIDGTISVTHARGDERYEPFTGDLEHPAAGEVIYRDEHGWAHARRWCHRQSGRSSVTCSTARALVVAEALHAEATADLNLLADHLRDALRQAGATARVRTGSE